MNQFEEMQNFVRIVEAGSITKAAEQLDTVKSAISRKLKNLETRLGISLLTRTTRTQQLTVTGKSYYEQCVRLLDDIAEVEATLSNENCALRGKIKIAAPLSFGLGHLGPALRQFCEINPEISFEIDFNDRIVDLVEEGFDLAIRIANLTDSMMIARRITKTQLTLCASPAYLKKHGTPITPIDLETGHVKLHYQNQPGQWCFEREGKSITVKIPRVLTANNGEFLCQSAIAGLGLAYLPDFICYKAVKLGQLVTVLPKYCKSNKLNAYALYPQTRHVSRRVRNLIDFLVQYYGDEPYWSIY